ncbi:hypothetical protein G3A43_06905 [Paraburkholderia aspalathi]|nr:hypothetical protein [Paraburkholderia aspalathi]MBK3779980.1 hypothetical protein [Paraburkholderia aspalathi]
MNYVLRYVFYAIGILVLTYMCSVNPEHVHFSDLVSLMQGDDWWRNVALVAVLLAAFDFTLGVSSLVSAVIPDRFIRKPVPQSRVSAPVNRDPA